MLLGVDPTIFKVSAAGGSSFHHLLNPGAEKIVFKVKSSNNVEYRIYPVYGFVEPGSTLKLEITRLAGVAGTDKVVVIYGQAPPTSTNPVTGFSTIAMNPTGYLTISISATL